MGLAFQQRYAQIEYPRVSLSPATRARARFLINTHYTRLYSSAIRFESPQSMRIKILELEAHMHPFRKTCPVAFKALAKQCSDFERICALLEILR